MKKSSEIASSLNKKAIVALLREKGPMSKADLSRALNLSFPAVSYNTKKLIEEHVICEIGTADNALGRKGTLLAFNARLSLPGGGGHRQKSHPRHVFRHGRDHPCLPEPGDPGRGRM